MQQTRGAPRRFSTKSETIGQWALGPGGKYELAAGVRVSDVPPIRQVNEAQITVRPQGGHHRPPQATVSHPV